MATGEEALAATGFGPGAVCPFGIDAGIRVIHLRFGVVLGPGPGTLGKLLPLFRLKRTIRV